MSPLFRSAQWSPLVDETKSVTDESLAMISFLGGVQVVAPASTTRALLSAVMPQSAPSGPADRRFTLGAGVRSSQVVPLRSQVRPSRQYHTLSLPTTATSSARMFVSCDTPFGERWWIALPIPMR